jgi:hypothetical protein
LIFAAAIGGLGYVLASAGPLDHGAWFLIILAGFILCDRSIWRRHSN